MFHQAALASVPRSVAAPLDTNAACVTGTVNLLDAARKCGVKRVVYAGSSSIYGDRTAAAAKHETDLPDPVSPYAAAKAAGELYCQAFTATYGLPTVTVRYFNVFGPRQDPNSEYSAVIPKFVTKMLAGERPTIFGDGKQSRDFTYVANVVDGNLLAASVPAAAGKTFNVACGEQLEPVGPGGGDQSRARHEDRADLRSAAGRRRPRQPGRHLARSQSARLQADDRFRRRPAPLDRVLPHAGCATNKNDARLERSLRWRLTTRSRICRG